MIVSGMKQTLHGRTDLPKPGGLGHVRFAKLVREIEPEQTVET